MGEVEVTFGIRPSPIKYSTELKEKAEEGDSEAQVNLGWCYFNGLGIDRDYKKAASWFQKAAEQGDAKAKRRGLWASEFQQPRHWRQDRGIGR